MGRSSYRSHSRSPSPKRHHVDRSRHSHSHRDRDRDRDSPPQDHRHYRGSPERAADDSRKETHIRTRRNSICHYRRHAFSRRDEESRQRIRRDVSPSLAERDHKRRRHDDSAALPRSSKTSGVPAVGQILRAKVHTVKPFGAFLMLEGFDKHALVHHSQVSEDLAFAREDEDADKIAALEYFCPTGAKVYVKIVDVQDDGRGGTRVNGSMRAVDQESGKDLDPSNSLAIRSRGLGSGAGAGPLAEGVPALNSVHKAQVASVKPFGAFVRLEGYRTNGLVHVSQVSDHMNIDKEDSDEAKVAAIAQVLGIGESVWVKVVEIKEADPGSDRGPKMGCSIKLVSQRDGSDLDPHGLKFRPKPSDGEFGQRKAVGADVGQVQQGTIDWGHLSADKVSLDPKYSEYKLLGADAEDVGDDGVDQGRQALHGLPPPPKKGLKKQQKKQHRLEENGISSVEEALAILKDHKKKSKHKKEKKEKKKKKSKKTGKKRQSSSES